MPIHPSAIIDPKAEIAGSADIGPFAVIEANVKIGENVKVYPNAYLSGWTEIGDDCEIHPGAVVGHLPQDFHFGGERSYCKIGAGTIIREFASIHRGTQPESWTTVGEKCFIMGYAHIGHNCEVGREVKVYNCTALSGHVIVDDYAIISGYSLIHQFVRIGKMVMIGGGTRLVKDLPPFMMALHDSECVGYNAIGLRRCERYTKDEIDEVRKAYRILFRGGTAFSKAVEQFEAEATSTKTGKEILEFIRAESKRGILGGRRQGQEAEEE